MERTRTCEMCQQAFSYEIGRGYDRRFCSDVCRTKRRFHNAKSQPLCVVEGCPNPRAYGNGICNSCYCRIRRTGTLERRKWKYRSLSTHGYVRLFDKAHPLAVSGYVYEHRKVLYDVLGDGPHQCHWCSVSVNWITGKCLRGSLVADHLDGVKTNNRKDNLVPACNKCNANRGLFMAWVQKHQDDPLLWEMYNASRVKSSA